MLVVGGQDEQPGTTDWLDFPLYVHYNVPVVVL